MPPSVATWILPGVAFVMTPAVSLQLAIQAKGQVPLWNPSKSGKPVSRTVVQLRAPAEDIARWRLSAGSARALSAWVRTACDHAAAADLASAADADRATRAELIALRANLGRGIGNLLDQIATRLHIDAKMGVVSSTDGIGEAIVQATAEISAIREVINTRLGSLPKRRARKPVGSQ